MFAAIKNTPHAREALAGGIMVFMLAIGGALLIVSIYSDIQARELIEAMAPSLRTLCFAIITASATIASLMLTTLGFTQRLNTKFELRFFFQIKMTSFLCTAALTLSVLILLILTIPITESENAQATFTHLYYVLIVGSATISSLIVSVIILLYRTMTDIIYAVEPSERTSPATVDPDMEQ